jgi:hypothetical protein
MEPRVSADNSKREPRMNADGRGSIRVGGERRALGAWGGWLGWKARVAAVLVVVAAGAVAVREVRGPVGRGGGTASDGDAVARVKPVPAPRAVQGQDARSAVDTGGAAPKVVEATTHADVKKRADVAKKRVDKPRVAAAPRRTEMPTAVPPARVEVPRSAGGGVRSNYLGEARSDVIRGRVVSAEGRPVAQAAVMFQGTRVGTLTKDDGSYALAVPPSLAQQKSAVLNVRRIGYQQASKAIALRAVDSATHDFSLAPSAMRLSEVVVTSAATTSDADSQVGPGASALRLVDRSTLRDVYGRVVQRRVYEVRPGVRVTLDAVRASDDDSGRDTAAQRGARRGRTPDASPAPTPIAAGINSIQWTDEDGTRFTLSGPLPLAELRALKPRVR